MKNLWYKIKTFFNVMLVSDHFILVDIKHTEYINQHEGKPYKVTRLYYQMNEYKYRLAIKHISELSDDIDLLLTQIEVEANSNDIVGE